MMRPCRRRLFPRQNDHPDVPDIFAQFHLIEVQTTYSVGSKKTIDEARRGALIIANLACR